MTDDPRLRRVAHWQDTVAMPPYKSREAWQARAAQIKQRILLAAGLLPEPERTPLRPLFRGRIERAGYSVESVAFESFPGFYCTGDLYRPLGTTSRVPAVLSPHGHWREGRFAHQPQGSVPARCISFARQGYVAFAPDMVGYNDSRQVLHRGFDSPHTALWGSGALGLQLWNNIRALDFLQSLPEVDGERIACTGESGGASQTFLLTAVDERVRFVAPVNMLSAHYAGGCICENAPGLRLELNNMEIVACAAPRPMLIVSATGDWTVNTPRVEYPAVRAVYELFGAAGDLECVQIDAPHNYNHDSRVAVYGFLVRHLGGGGEPAPRPAAATFWTGPSEPVAEAEVTPEPEAVRRIFPDAEPLPAAALPDQTAVTRALEERARRRLAADLPHDAAGVQRFAAVYRPLLAQTLAAAFPAADELTLQRHTTLQELPFAIQRLELGTRRHGERLPAYFITPVTPASRPAVLLLDQHGTSRWLGDDLAPAPLVRALVERGQSVLLADLFLTGSYLSPFGAAGRPAGEAHFTGYNRADSAWRAQDVLTCVAALAQLAQQDRVLVAGTGEAGLWALLARALAPERVAVLAADLCGVGWDDAQAYLSGLAIPHLLRVGGLSTAAVLAAPQPAALFNAAGRVPASLASLYRELGEGGALRVHDGRPSDQQLLAALEP